MKQIEYKPGDWIVHKRYGVGQVEKIEIKPIHGEETRCLRVTIQDGVYWLPVGDQDNPRIRRVASSNHLQQAIEELSNVDQDLEEDRKLWKQRIEEVRSEGNLIEMSQLVRDLTLLSTQRRLNQTEETALKSLMERMLQEWSAASSRDIDTIRPTLNSFLQDSKRQFEAG